MRQLMLALEYLHSQGIVHRDIRPHNVVLASKDNSAPLKVCGFGVAIKLSNPNERVKAGRVGVVQFMAPEVVSNVPVGTSADIWSAGVLLYLLLSGRLPFTGSTEDVYRMIRDGNYSLNAQIWSQISDSAKDLLRRMLNVNSHSRISATDILQHEWISNRETYAPKRHLPITVEYIRRYNEARKLKSSILAAVNGDKWQTLRSPAVSFLSGQSPGGDSCHPDGCTKSDHVSVPTDLVGAHKILQSLDAMTVLMENSDPPSRNGRESLDRDEQFKELLDLYDRIAQLNCAPVPSEQEASTLNKDVIASIDSLLAPSTEAQELKQLLHSTHLVTCLQAHDVVVSEICDTDDRSHTPPGPPPDRSTMENHASTSTSQVPFSYLNGGVLPLGANRAGTSTEEYPTTSFACDDEDDLLNECVSRIRLVQFQKDTEEPMGITLKVTEEGRCFVARIMHGGMIHRQATLHVGDEIREINGISVTNRSVDSLQQMLRDARGQVTFKIVPSYRSAPPACEIFVRAQFDYDPAQDDLNPCPQAGVPFKTGDILQVISKDDHNWWQARFVSSFPSIGTVKHPPPGTAIAGLIPSPELQEWRTACLAMERAKDQSHCMWFNKKKKYYTTKYLQKHSALFDQLDLVTYEEVMRLSSYRRKTLVLLGAHGVGRRHIKNTLIHRHPNRFAYPIPHTTRPPRKDEIDGKHYYFVSTDQMRQDIQSNEYLEYGTHEESMYGTKLETIRNIHKSGKIAILDVEPQALKVLRTAEYSPFVVFIAAPNLQGMQDPDGSLERLLRESDILRQAFGHLFDYIIVNNDIDETIQQLERLVEKLPACPQWLPVSWVY
ncbi:hypothetical protein WR25_16302 [Diploscapter pachys]|uniref:Uncharacterized protein n=1 Tax=Diploscapter pachys TaxID=2018661 RepID=A0A2A2KIU8_9BILA|nr:hypothetical protein WR25_16302 [Diploscapter pachys]